MYPNLLGQKAFRHLTADDMGNIIGVSRQTYSQKIASGNFTPVECMKYVKFFGKPFDFLFATDDDITQQYNGQINQ